MSKRVKCDFNDDNRIPVKQLKPNNHSYGTSFDHDLQKWLSEQSLKYIWNDSPYHNAFSCVTGWLYLPKRFLVWIITNNIPTANHFKLRYELFLWIQKICFFLCSYSNLRWHEHPKFLCKISKNTSRENPGGYGKTAFTLLSWRVLWSKRDGKSENKFVNAYSELIYVHVLVYVTNTYIQYIHTVYLPFASTNK